MLVWEGWWCVFYLGNLQFRKDIFLPEIVNLDSGEGHLSGKLSKLSPEFSFHWPFLAGKTSWAFATSTIRREKGFKGQLLGQKFPLHLHVLDITQVVVLHSPTSRVFLYPGLLRCDLPLLVILYVRTEKQREICSFTGTGTDISLGVKQPASQTEAILPDNCPAHLDPSTPYSVWHFFFIFSQCIESPLCLVSVVTLSETPEK